MSYSMTFVAPDIETGHEVFDLCQMGDWTRFREWAKSLPPKFKAVKTLAEKGEFKDTFKLSVQLENALLKHPPTGDVFDTCDEMLERIGVGDRQETLRITDGCNGDEDDPTDNVFCPTGPSGGVDPSCSPGQGDSPGGNPTSRVLPHDSPRARGSA